MSGPPTDGGPTTAVTVWWQVHVLVAGLGLVAAIVLRAPVLVVLATPSVLLVAVAISWRHDPAPEVSVTVVDDRLVSDDRTSAVVTVTSARPRRLTVEVPVRGALRADAPVQRRLRVGPGAPVTFEVGLTAGRWGVAHVGPGELRWASPGRLVAVTSTAPDTSIVRVLPRTAPARSLPRPRATHAATGTQRSDASGTGLEFASLRPFVPGDRARDISAHVSARRGAPWIVHRHPDRRTDVVLLLDAFDHRELPDVLAAARAVARGHLRAGDRVGLTTMTGVLRWLPPGDGPRHEHRIATALIEADLAHSWVRPAVEHLPRQVLPPGALVLGITPGTDPRLPDTSVILRRRGWDVAVLVVTPGVDADDPVLAAAQRLVRLERRTVRDRLHAHGVPTVGWDPTTTVDTALSQLVAWRGRGRTVPVRR